MPPTPTMTRKRMLERAFCLFLCILQLYQPCLAAAAPAAASTAAVLTVEETSTASSSTTTTTRTILAQNDTNDSSSLRKMKNMIPQELQLRRRRQQRQQRQLEPFRPTPKVVGGTEVAKGRYPYIVVLLDRSFQLICGGSLIAPNVVLTAAHCTSNIMEYALVGPSDMKSLMSSGGGAETHSSSETNDDYELIRLQPEEYVHPLYNDTGLRYDVLIVLLERPSTRPYVTINSDPNLPSRTDWSDPNDSTTTARQSNTNQNSSKTDTEEGGLWNETLIALGFGVGTSSTKLQEVTLDYVDNDDCVSSSLGRDIYAGVISDEMMCSFRLGHDTCSGDSGGPLLLVRQRQTAPEYSWTIDSETVVVIPPVVEESVVQVGITSWGYEECATPFYPGVSSRISSSYQWIRETVCRLTPDTAPDYFECELLTATTTFSPKPSPSPMAPTLSPAPTSTTALTFPCLVYIVLDAFASEIYWSLFDYETRSTIAGKRAGTYTHEDEVMEIVPLIPGRNYRFRISDIYGDGIFGPGTGYSVIFGTKIVDGLRLVEGSGDFGPGRSHNFTVPEHMPSSLPSIAPTTTPTITAASSSPTITNSLAKDGLTTIDVPSLSLRRSVVVSLGVSMVVLLVGSVL